MSNPWIREYWRIFALALTALAVGAMVGQVLVVFLCAVLVYLGWHLYHLQRLERWFAEGQQKDPPDAKGIWGEVFYQVFRLKQKNRIAKKKLANMLSRFEKSTAAMPDATVVLNPHNEIEWFNKAAKDQLGLKKKKDRGQRIDNLIRFPQFVTMLNSGDFSQPVIIPSPVDKNISLSIRLIPYAKKQLLLVARDITRLQRLEQIRRDFVANISHELKTPLTVMSGYLENFLEDDELAAGPYQKALGQMQQQTDRMARIVDDLLMLSRLETDELIKTPEPVAVPVVLTSLCEDAKLLAKDKQQVVHCEIDTSLWLQGSEKELHSAFSNLISNAVKYSPVKGEIKVQWFADDNGAQFIVNDNGDGFTAEHIPRLTERFYRIDPGRSREQGGTGLGLAIVKHVLSRHDARLSIESEPGQGSTFICHFPKDKLIIKAEKLEQKVS